MNKTKIETIKALEEAAKVLKTEFIALDKMIDELIDSFKSWYITPEVNERPSVISLFGMTGTGKTSLVRRLLELLGLSYKTLFFDCGAESNDNNTESIADKIDKYLNAEDNEVAIDNTSQDLIFVFDEFQHARTINESGQEVNKSNLRPMWELVDNGIVSLHCNEWELSYLTGFIEDIKSFAKLHPGLKLNEEGELVKEDEIRLILDNLGYFYYDRGVPGLMGSKSKWDNTTRTKKEDVDDFWKKPLRVLEERAIRIIIRRLNSRNCGDNLSVFKDLMSCETIDALVEKLEEIYPKISAPKSINCSKALVIILGNLDEAFKVEKEISPDIDADIFYDETSKVTVNDIKTALMRRFRAEQIARLGNTIIKYPTIKGEDFRKIIEMETKRIIGKFEETEGIEIKVSKNMIDLLYSEGVYPAQGVRPVFTTIGTILTPLLSDILINKDDTFNEGYIEIDVKDPELGYNLPKKTITLTHSANPDKDFGREIPLALGELRDPGKCKTIYINAIHEVGHAILTSYLTGKVPTNIVASSSTGGGFCTTYDPDKVGEISCRGDVKNKIMIALAGYEAEKLIFGKMNDDKTLLGSGSDIYGAWKILSDVAYNSGYFKPLQYSNYEVESSGNIPGGLDDRLYLQSSIEVEFNNLREQTRKILKENKKLLLKAAIRLGKIGKMGIDEFMKFIEDFGETLSTERLKEAVKENNPEFYLEFLIDQDK